MDIERLFQRLDRSAFRSRFHLKGMDLAYLRAKGLPVVLDHARDLIARRLAPAHPVNDGKQTPYKGHPVFVAQHATATCCRGCLAKWHGMPEGRALSDEEQAQVVGVIGCWLEREARRSGGNAT